MVSKWDHKTEPNSPKWVPKAIPKRCSKEQQKHMIFSTLECGSSVVNTFKINDFQLLVLVKILTWAPNAVPKHVFQKALKTYDFQDLMNVAQVL